LRQNGRTVADSLNLSGCRVAPVETAPENVTEAVGVNIFGLARALP
jgi:Trk K+ transport system NAD-binding subunit